MNAMHTQYNKVQGNAYNAAPVSATRNSTSATGELQVTSGPVDQYSPNSGSSEGSLGLYNPRMFSGNGGQGVSITAPPMRDSKATSPNAPAASTSAFADLSSKEQRAAYVDRMNAAGIKASNPPTEKQLTEYFSTFNNDKARGQAPGQYEDYAKAFHIHEASTDKPGDVKYSPEKSYTVDGQTVYKTLGEAKKANPGQNWFEVSTADASSWKDVSNRPAHKDGRKIQDCEGFAYMGGKLLGAAGYQPTQVATGDKDNGHAMAVFKDPNGGNSVVVSNEQTFSGTNEDQLLQDGWGFATGNDGRASGKMYRGTTGAEAQSRQVAEREGFPKR